MTKPFVVRQHLPGWAPMFMSWHKSRDAANRAARRYRRQALPTSLVKYVVIDMRSNESALADEKKAREGA